MADKGEYCVRPRFTLTMVDERCSFLVMTDTSNRHILIVEDEILLLNLIIKKFEARGWMPVGARSVDEAIAFIQELDAIHSVWLDHFLPGREGHEFLRYLRGHKQWKHLPVVFVSNAIEADIVNIYVQLGIVGFFPKISTPLDHIIDQLDLYLQTGGQSSVTSPEK